MSKLIERFRDWCSRRPKPGEPCLVVNVNVTAGPSCCPAQPITDRGVVVLALGRAVDTVSPSPGAAFSRVISEEPNVAMDIETRQVTTVRVLAFKNRRGDPVGVDGVPVWATDDSNVVVGLEPSLDGMSCKVTTGTIEGAAKVQVTADGDRSSGVSLLTGTVDFVVKSPPAVNVDLETDPPVDA